MYVMSSQNRYSSLWSVFKADIMMTSEALWCFFYPSHSLSPSSLLDRSTCHSVDHTRRHSHTHTCVDSRCQSVPEYILNTKHINRMFEKQNCQFGNWKLLYIFTGMCIFRNAVVFQKCLVYVLPSSHATPVHPLRHVQCPLIRSHDPPFWHKQCWWQPTP